METDIRSEPSKTAEERRRIMELLKKFEEDSLKQDEVDDGEESDDDETNELSKRLRGVDLGELPGKFSLSCVLILP